MSTVFVLKTYKIKSTPSEKGAEVISVPRTAYARFLEETSGDFSKIEYYGKVGWIPSALIEPYAYESEEIVYIPREMKTPSLDDAEQFVKMDGKIKHNLCGFLCVSFLTMRNFDVLMNEIEEFLPSVYAAVQRDEGIGIGTLKDILDFYHKKNISFQSGLTNEYGYLISPARIQSFIFEKSYSAIVGVKIDSNGKLDNPIGHIGHWVVLIQIVSKRDGGDVLIYNPFTNRLETYSYTEFINSMTRFGSAVGIWTEASFKFGGELPLTV